MIIGKYTKIIAGKCFMIMTAEIVYKVHLVHAFTGSN